MFTCRKIKKSWARTCVFVLSVEHKNKYFFGFHEQSSKITSSMMAMVYDTSLVPINLDEDFEEEEYTEEVVDQEKEEDKEEENNRPMM